VRYARILHAGNAGALARVFHAYFNAIGAQASGLRYARILRAGNAGARPHRKRILPRILHAIGAQASGLRYARILRAGNAGGLARNVRAYSTLLERRHPACGTRASCALGTRASSPAS
jgi:hypothetical protein